MNTYNGMALAEVIGDNLKDGQKVTYISLGRECDGVIQSKPGHTEKRKWTCRHADEDGLDNLWLKPEYKDGEAYFYID